jgi:vancomycin resistance protein YoaR
MSRKRIILSAILLSISLWFTGNAVYASAEEKANTIVKGVFIDEVDVSGMTKEQAKTAVDEYVKQLRNKGVAIMVGDNVIYTTMGELGYMVEENDAVSQALSLGKSGNLIKRYKDMKDIEQGNIVFPLSFIYDETKIRDIVAIDVSAYNVAPVNATVTRKDGKFIYTDHKLGKKVNIEETVARITNAIDNWNKQDILVDAVVDDDVPIYTRDIVEQCKDLIGSYTTEYASSSADRAGNVANGAKLINNTVLFPGDVFSAYKVLTPFTKENGYFVAGAYLQGKVIDSVGGGACQVTTTLYNAVLQAELEVVERQPHSMTISYVELSRDAAIAGTTKDFKFMNNTDVPILVEGITKGRTITFNIWGKETRDTKNRRIEYVTVVKSKTAPPADVITKDPNQPESYQKVTQSAHTGYKAELYKVVYENGVETSRTLVNKSNYQAAPKYITVGTKKEDEDKSDTKKGAKDKTKQDKSNPKKTPSDHTQQDSEPNNLTNPDGQIQADIYDDSWFEEGYEDE